MAPGPHHSLYYGRLVPGHRTARGTPLSTPRDALAEGLSGSYVLQEEIGRGGMATVYRAQDLKHDRAVALKVLHPELAASVGPERFQREIRFAARLQHPHILSVFDSGQAAGQFWFTMPFVSGESLRERLRRSGRLPVDDALQVVREAAQGLAYAHRQGVVHRDIKPENILLTDDGSTLVADFGIARALGDTDAGGVTTHLTQTGSAIGTPTYMAPEQATGEKSIDERADQYALAAVLYEMLTGEPPFTGATSAALIAARFTSEVPSARARRAEVPGSVDAALTKALALKAADRFPTITDFARAVAPSLATPQRTDTVALARAPRRRGAWWAAGGAAAVAVAAAGFAFQARRAAPAAEAGPVRIAVLPFENQGDSADAYFADGVADAVRGKLVTLPGVEVIARASSLPYRGTTKTPKEIAQELGVRYLLTGTVRFVKQPDGTGTMRLAPELVEVSAQGASASRWQQSIDRPLTNVFAAETEVAEQVAGALRLALGGAERTRLAEAPTENAAAYDLYLRARARTGNDPATTRETIRLLEQAVALDPRFAEAWALLSRSRAVLYVNSVPEQALGRAARDAAERAVALAPDRPEGHLALNVYHASITLDEARAEAALERALTLGPNDPIVLARLGGLRAEQDGRIDEGIALLEASLRVDPLNAPRWDSYAQALALARRLPEALVAANRGLALDPARLSGVMRAVSIHAGLGDLDGARETVRAMYRALGRDSMTVDTYLSIYEDYGWVLDDAAQRRVLAAPVAAFDGDDVTQAQVRAHIAFLRGDRAASARHGAAAAAGFVRQLRDTPGDVQRGQLLGLALAFAGRRDEARAQLERVRAAGEATPSLYERSYYSEVRARAFVVIGDHARALDELERTLGRPSILQPGHLRIDPMWAPLRNEPRFQRLLAGGAPAT